MIFIAPIIYLFVDNVHSCNFTEVNFVQLLQLLAIVLLSFYIVQKRSDMRVKAEMIEKIALKALSAYQLFCEEAKRYLDAPQETGPDNKKDLRSKAYIQVKSVTNYYNLVQKIARFNKEDKEMMKSLLDNWEEINCEFGDMVASDPKTIEFLGLLRKNTPLIEHKTYCLIIAQYQK